MELDIGFTGTQIGLTEPQQRVLRDMLKSNVRSGNSIFFHHGDCVGADAQAHDIALPLSRSVVIHPPTNPSKRAWCSDGYNLPEKEYLKRNHDIVDACDLLIATPKGFFEELRSGTWATIRYAIKSNKPVSIIWPNGHIQDGKDFSHTKNKESSFNERFRGRGTSL